MAAMLPVWRGGWLQLVRSKENDDTRAKMRTATLRSRSDVWISDVYLRQLLHRKYRLEMTRRGQQLVPVRYIHLAQTQGKIRLGFNGVAFSEKYYFENDMNMI